MADDSMTTRHTRNPLGMTGGKIVSSDVPPATENNQVIYKLRASRLTTLFPDELIIQEKAVSAVRRKLFSSDVETMPLGNIGRVIYMDNPFSACIKIIGMNPLHELCVTNLPKGEAKHAKDILDGLLLQRTGDINIPDDLHVEHKRQILAQEGGARSTGQ